MYHYSNILFDLDGTLIDSKPGVLACVRKTAKELSFKLPPDNQLDGFMGPPLEDCFTQVCGLDFDLVAHAIKIYRGHYESGGIFNVSVFEGIEKLLRTLKQAGCTLGIATSKNEKFANIVLKYCGIRDYFDIIAGEPCNIDFKWTKKDSVVTAMAALCGANSENTVLVGDRRFDAEGARDAGINSIGVLFGYGSKEELEASDFMAIANDVDELLELL